MAIVHFHDLNDPADHLWESRKGWERWISHTIVVYGRGSGAPPALLALDPRFAVRPACHSLDQLLVHSSYPLPLGEKGPKAELVQKATVDCTEVHVVDV